MGDVSLVHLTFYKRNEEDLISGEKERASATLFYFYFIQIFILSTFSYPDGASNGRKATT